MSDNGHIHTSSRSRRELRRRARQWSLGAAVVVLAIAAMATVVPVASSSAGTSVTSGSQMSHSLGRGSGSLGSALVGSAPVGNGPSELAVDAATDTAYVANGYNDNGPNAGGDTVSVINTRHCQALDVSRCKGPWPTIKVGNEPSTIAVDAATDTVYVDNNGANTVSVFNGATCNAMDTSGCDQKPATVPVGSQPMGIFVDDTNHTVYVGNPGKGNTVSMIDSATCNASDLATCPKTQPPTVKVGSPAEDVVVDEATQTVYVGTLAAVSVFDANTCNATVQTGCGDIGTLKGDSYSGPNGFGIDPANDTLYTANYDNSISAWDLADCNASDLAGCAKQKPGYVLPFPYSQWDSALWLVVDVPLHSVYVAYQRDDALIVVDTNLCDGGHLARCATLHPPEVPTGAMPESVDLDLQTQTLYAVNQIDNDVSVIDASACDALVTRGCRQAPTAVPISTPANGFETYHGGNLEAPSAADTAVNTVYVPTSASAVAMINTVTCNGHAPTGCADKPPQVTVGANPSAVAIDALTDTVYVANFGSATKAGPGTVSVIDAGTCNATETGGCAHLGTLQVPGGNAYDIAVNATTDTIYVATLTDSGPDLISVFNGATCNATETSGCHQGPATVSFGNSGEKFDNSIVNVAVNPATNTVYATNVADISGQRTGDSVYMVKGTTCEGADTTGCGETPLAIPAGNLPWGITVDQSTDTVYAVIEASGDSPATVGVIDGATCNSADVSGCGQLSGRTVAVGFSANEIAIDPTNHVLYTTNHSDATISAIEGSTCNRLVSSGCHLATPRLPAGTYPNTIAIDPAVDTAYVAGLDGVSVIPLAP